MSEPLTLLLLYGGKSGEHEISLRSAASVLQALDPRKYIIIPVGIDKAGKFFINPYEEMLNYAEALPVKSSQAQPLPSFWIDGKLAIDADVVFPVTHGPLYEGGCLQGLLELADAAFVGCPTLASAIGMDKDIARRLVCDETISCAKYYSISKHMPFQKRSAYCEKIIAELGWPLFIKPCSLGSSVGIHKVKDSVELENALKDAFQYDEEVLIEAFIRGREIELAVLENKDLSLPPRVSLPGEILVRNSEEFYSYEAKYIEVDKTELIYPAVLEPKITTCLQDMAAKIFIRTKCKGMARVDFFVDDLTQRIYFNEINTIPGFTSISMYPKLWEISGVAYPALLDELIELAMLHHQLKKER